MLAERMGFEPMARCRVTGFQDRLLKPLGHLSIYYRRSEYNGFDYNIKSVFYKRQLPSKL